MTLHAITTDLDRGTHAAETGSLPQHEALRLVRQMADAMERRILAQSEAQSRPAPDDSPTLLHPLQDQLVHLARVAALGTLAVSIAHEIRQPLTSIRVESYAMQRWISREVPDTGEVIDGIRRIQEQSERAEQVIRSLRALMRRETTAHHALQLDQTILDILPLVQARLYDADITLQLDIDGMLPALHGDRVQIQQIVLNLLLNAMDAFRDQPHGSGAKVELRVGRSEPGMACIEVIDNGCGIDAEKISQIFDLFVSTKHDGMGIGLAICRMIAEAHGGTIRAASEGGKTTMTVSLPLPAPLPVPLPVALHMPVPA